MKIGNAGGILHKTLLKRPLKAVEVIGRGGTHEKFLSDVHPMTRTLRIGMTFGRAIEASPDNRFWEVLIAELMAFMRNRSARWWSRHLTDGFCERILFPVYVTHFS